MAYICNKRCDYCRHETTHLNGICNNCRDRLFREREAIWKSKNLDERLEELRKRIEKLESGNRYS